ncbi:MAG: NAD(+)/NADH kinase [Candidatus Anstonellaceae archaeon]
MLRRAVIISNPKKQAAKDIAKQVKRFLSTFNILITNNLPQLVVTVGGDGTVLFAKKYYGVPFFSIGSKTSFICQATFSDWKQKLLRVLKGFRKEPRILLEAKIGKKQFPPALNEVGVRSTKPQLLSFQLFVGKKKYAFRADGILFSTPTGSPAYCYSCGGKQMPKESNSYQAVAICPFRRTFKPIILSPSSKCKLHLSGNPKAHFFVDGKIMGSLSQGQILEVKVSNRLFFFAQPNKSRK